MIILLQLVSQAQQPKPARAPEWLHALKANKVYAIDTLAIKVKECKTATKKTVSNHLAAKCLLKQARHVDDT